MANWLANVIPARKAPKSPGTSYSATGLLGTNTEITPPDIGAEDGSSRPVVIREIVPALGSPRQRTEAWARMMNDAAVDVGERIVKTPVLGSEFYIESYSPAPEDVMVSDFIWDNLYGGMNAPLCNSLEDILHFFEDGYSVLDKIYEDRVWSPKDTPGSNSKSYTMLQKLAVRPATTIKEIHYDDNGGPNGVTQTAIRADNSTEDVEIDISKLLIFTWNRYGGDLTGRSILRTAYPHWYYKNHFYKIDAVQKERHSLGIPHGKLLPGFNPKDREILRTMLRNVRTNEEAFIITTPTVEVEFMEVRGQLVDVLASAREHNGMILLNVMAQFMALGLEMGSGGGRASSGSQIDMFMKALKYVANYICDQINMYLIPELVVWNFPTNRFPKLKVRNIGETRDLQNLASAYSSLIAQEAVTVDDPLEDWMRATFDMPRRDPSTTRVKAGTVDPAGGNGNQPTKGGVNPNRSKTGNNGKPPNADQ